MDAEAAFNAWIKERFDESERPIEPALRSLLGEAFFGGVVFVSDDMSERLGGGK